MWRDYATPPLGLLIYAIFRMACKLADETLAVILSIVLEVADDDFISMQTDSGPFARRDYSTADALLVCKRWMRVATPLLLYTCIIRYTAQAQALANALKKNPELAQFVKRMRIEGSYGASVKQFLTQTKQIDELAISMPDLSKDNAKPMYSVLGTLCPRRLVLFNFSSTGNAQSIFAAEALRAFLRSSESLVRGFLSFVGFILFGFQQEMVCSLYSFQSAMLLPDMAPTITKLSIWMEPNTFLYNQASHILDKWPRLRYIEFICDRVAPELPTEDVLKRHGNQLFLRVSGERYAVDEFNMKRDLCSCAEPECPAMSSRRSNKSTNLRGMSPLCRFLAGNRWKITLFRCRARFGRTCFGGTCTPLPFAPPMRTGCLRHRRFAACSRCTNLFICIK